MLPRDLASRTHTFTFQETDWVAVLRADDLVGNEPVWIRDDGLCFIKRYGQFELAESVPGFQKYIELPPAPKNRNKTLFNPHTQQAVDTGLLPDEFEREREQWKTLVH